jgi:hypothetical protein
VEIRMYLNQFILSTIASKHHTYRKTVYIAIIMVIMMVMVTSMGREYVSELRLPTGLLFIPQVIYKHGEPWWNEVDRGQLMIRPPELSGNPTSTDLIASRRNRRRK